MTVKQQIEKVYGIKLLDFCPLIKAATAPNRGHLFLAGKVNHQTQEVILYRGDLKEVVVPFSWFHSPIVTPDFTDLEIIDNGNAVRLGQFATSANTLFDYEKEIVHE